MMITGVHSRTACRSCQRPHTNPSPPLLSCRVVNLIFHPVSGRTAGLHHTASADDCSAGAVQHGWQTCHSHPARGVHPPQAGHTSILHSLILQGMAPASAGLAAGLPYQVRREGRTGTCGWVEQDQI